MSDVEQKSTKSKMLHSACCTVEGRALEWTSGILLRVSAARATALSKDCHRPIVGNIRSAELVG